MALRFDPRCFDELLGLLMTADSEIALAAYFERGDSRARGIELARTRSGR